MAGGTRSSESSLYGHYDVQPVDPVDLWHSPPFEPEVRNGEIYARGSADDKGQVFMHFKSMEAHLGNFGKLPVNVKILIEGEEECGSLNLDRFIAEHREMLRADLVLISDTPPLRADLGALHCLPGC